MRGIETNHYQKARAEIVLFDNCDVITTSGNAGENGGCPGYGWDYQPGICQGGWGGTGNIPQG